MKKFITLLIAAGAFATAMAQSDSRTEEAKRVILGPKKSTPTQNPKDVVTGKDGKRIYGDDDNNRNPESYPSGTSRESEIDHINYEYDRKIQSIRNNPYLSREEKDRMIRQLNKDRNERIRQVNNDYRRYEEDRQNNDRRRNEDDDDDYKRDKKYKKNNGKHLGWEKGKGNPHRGRH